MKTPHKFMALLALPALAMLAVFLFSNAPQSTPMPSTYTLENLPTRKGERPSTTPTNPHTQLDQQPKDLIHVQTLMDWAFDLAHIEKRPSAISVPGAVAMCMQAGHTCDQCNAFMIGTEFAHFHPHPDHSLHLGLRQSDAEILIEKGWGEWHPMIKRGILPPNIIMLYAPRDKEELDVAKFILGRSYDFAQGKLK
ncbi:MAG: phospholipase [Bacteroidota bacterium]